MDRCDTRSVSSITRLSLNPYSKISAQVSSWAFFILILNTLCYKVTSTLCLISSLGSAVMHETPPEKTFWGWKALIVAFILSIAFLGIFYVAMENDPDYMPSQQNKGQSHQQHAFKNAPTMKQDAETAASAATEPSMSAEQHGMTAEQHANMNMSHGEGNHGH